MTMYVLPGFDFRRTAIACIYVTEATGPLSFGVIVDSAGFQRTNSSGTVTGVSDADTQWCHEDLESIMGTGKYDDFRGGLAAALTAGSAAHGNTLTYLVSWSRANQRYTLTTISGSFALSFTTVAGVLTAAGGTHMRRILGFSGDSASAASHEGTIRPYYSIVPAAALLSQVTRPRAMRGLISGMVTANGSHYAVAPTTVRRIAEASCRFESAAAATIAAAGTPVFTTDITSGVPWSWEHFFDHVSAIEPFRVDDGTHDWVMTLQPESAHFDPTRDQPDYDMWHIKLAGYYEGSL